MRVEVCKLIDKIKKSSLSDEEKSKVIADVNSALMNFKDYTNKVIEGVIQSDSVVNYDAMTMYMMKQNDEERRYTHDLCIKSCYSLNELCLTFNVPDVCTFDLNDRHAVAAFIGQFVSEYYSFGIEKQKSFDEIVIDLSKKGKFLDDVDEYEL